MSLSRDIHQTLLGFVAESTSFVRSSGARSTVNRRQLSVLPDTDPKQETHHVTLLLPIQLLDVLVRTHLEVRRLPVTIQ